VIFKKNSEECTGKYLDKSFKKIFNGMFWGNIQRNILRKYVEECFGTIFKEKILTKNCRQFRSLARNNCRSDFDAVCAIRIDSAKFFFTKLFDIQIQFSIHGWALNDMFNVVEHPG